MERLTHWRGEGAFINKKDSYKNCSLSADMKTICFGCIPEKGLKHESCPLGSAIRKLAEYEDMIEQGKLTEVVRCEECKYENSCEHEILRDDCYGTVGSTDTVNFCSFGVKKDG